MSHKCEVRFDAETGLIDRPLRTDRHTHAHGHTHTHTHTSNENSISAVQSVHLTEIIKGFCIQVLSHDVDHAHLGVSRCKIFNTVWYQRQKCRPLTLVCGDIRFMRIFAEVTWGGGVKRQWACRQRQFSAFSLQVVYYYISIMQSLVGFSLIPMCMTLNELECLFHVKFCFHTGTSCVGECNFRQ